jgi:hypothetical protein
MDLAIEIEIKRGRECSKGCFVRRDCYMTFQTGV